MPGSALGYAFAVFVSSLGRRRRLVSRAGFDNGEKQRPRNVPGLYIYIFSEDGFVPSGGEDAMMASTPSIFSANARFSCLRVAPRRLHRHAPSDKQGTLFWWFVRRRGRARIYWVSNFVTYSSLRII